MVGLVQAVLLLLVGQGIAAGATGEVSVAAGGLTGSTTGRVERTDRQAPESALPLTEAILLALENNRDLRVQRLVPKIKRTFEEEKKAVFDQALSGTLSVEQRASGSDSALGAVGGDSAADAQGGSLSLSGRFPTGTCVEAVAETSREEDAAGRVRYVSRAGLSITQSLLQGRPIEVNLADVRQAELDSQMSDYELRAVTEALVADVESAYWECVLAQRRIRILEDSLALAEQQFREVRHRIRVGSLPETELAAAQAETAVRREALLNARSVFSAAELRLLRLIAPRELGRPRGVLTLTTEPVVPADELGSVEEHVAVAMRMRPELRQAELRLRKGELEAIRTRNGLLPRLDFFVRLGDTGYAQALREALAEIDGRDLSFSFGLSGEYPLANRGARARHTRALLSLRQTEESLANLADLVRLDVETAYIEVRRTREQVAATATTRQLQEEKLRSENAKFAVGRSTSLLVGQAQRDLLASQVAEIESVVKHLEALAAFFRAEGSLLLRRGIRMPEETSAGNLERIRDVR